MSTARTAADTRAIEASRRLDARKCRSGGTGSSGGTGMTAGTGRTGGTVRSAAVHFGPPASCPCCPPADPAPPAPPAHPALFLVQLPPCTERIEVHDRVEHQEVAALRLAAPDGIVRE